MKVFALIMAAGSGKRMGGSVKKQFLKLADKEILSHTLETFDRCSAVDGIVIVTSADEKDHVKELSVNMSKVICITEGGSERQYSVLNGLRILKECDIVLIHDGVRPFVRQEDILTCIGTAQSYGASVLGVPVKDTVKVCNAEGEITATPDRKTLWLAQTPQAFKYDIIMKAYEYAEKENFLGTDDASVVERYGIKVKMVMGNYNNIKITTPEDLILGNAIIARMQ